MSANQLLDETVESFTSGRTGNLMWRVSGWASCRCGKEYRVVQSDENRLLALHAARQHQMGTCRRCSNDFHVVKDMCPEGGCDQSYAHTGRCRASWSDGVDMDDAYRRAHEKSMAYTTSLASGPLLVPGSWYETGLNVRRRIREFMPEVHGTGCVLRVLLGADVHALMSERTAYDWELPESLRIAAQADDRFADVVIEVGGSPADVLLAVIEAR